MAKGEMKAYIILLGYIMPGKRNEKQEEPRREETKEVELCKWLPLGNLYPAMDHWAFEDPYKLHPKTEGYSGYSEGGETGKHCFPV